MTLSLAVFSPLSTERIWTKIHISTYLHLLMFRKPVRSQTFRTEFIPLFHNLSTQKLLLMSHNYFLNHLFTFRSVLRPLGWTMVTRRGLSALSSAWRVWKRGRWVGGGGGGGGGGCRKWDLWTCPAGWGRMGHGWGIPPGRFNEGMLGGADTGERERRTRVEEQRQNPSAGLFKVYLTTVTSAPPHRWVPCTQSKTHK